jgi:hypothetical protein
MTCDELSDLLGIEGVFVLSAPLGEGFEALFRQAGGKVTDRGFDRFDPCQFDL